MASSSVNYKAGANDISILLKRRQDLLIIREVRIIYFFFKNEGICVQIDINLKEVEIISHTCMHTYVRTYVHTYICIYLSFYSNKFKNGICKVFFGVF